MLSLSVCGLINYINFFGVQNIILLLQFTSYLIFIINIILFVRKIVSIVYKNK